MCEQVLNADTISLMALNIPENNLVKKNVYLERFLYFYEGIGPHYLFA